MSVSPQGNSDNVFVHVPPALRSSTRCGSRPPDGKARAFTGITRTRTAMSTIRSSAACRALWWWMDFERLYPLLRGLPERYLLIKHAQIDGGEVVSINGQINPLIAMRPGEMQFWRIAHIGASLFLKFRIEGMALYVVGTDGHPLSQPRKVSEFFIGPGERIEAIAVGPPPGEYAMRTISFQNEAWRPPESGARSGADRIERRGGADGHC